jgi:pyruvate kinase
MMSMPEKTKVKSAAATGRNMNQVDVTTLLSQIKDLRRQVEQESQPTLEKWRPHIHRNSFALSACNLAHYLVFRRHDLRQLQRSLMVLGLSSLGRCEARVMPNLEAVIASLEAICATNHQGNSPHPSSRRFFQGERLLRRHTRLLLGPEQSQRWVRIMVTLPTAAQDDYDFFCELLQRGTDCVRINCAHDTPAQWKAMVQHLRRAEAETGRRCKLLMDLGGIQPRTTDVIAPDPDERRIHQGDLLLLSHHQPQPREDVAFQCRCTVPEVLEQLEPGRQVWIDDGKIGSRVESITDEGIWLKVHQARPKKGEKLKADKGLNFPDTPMYFDALGDKEYQHLDFIAAHADIVGYSFVQQAKDIQRLQEALRDRAPSHRRTLGLMAKVETPAAIHNLPELMVQAAGQQPFGVMIARGDLAVEVGYERLAEIQEEILWLCEAAHLPVIWATEVLHDMAKQGTPSRSEMTDAAMAERSECVMLNKGSFIPETVTILDDVLKRMEAHQFKKTPQLRALKSWQ